MLSRPPSPQGDQMRLRIDTHAMQHLRMLDGLQHAKGGLHNLLQTYRDDAASASQVRLLIEEIDDFLRVMQPHTVRLRQLSPRCRTYPSSVSVVGSE